MGLRSGIFPVLSAIASPTAIRSFQIGHIHHVRYWRIWIKEIGTVSQTRRMTFRIDEAATVEDMGLEDDH